ncbi:putative ABC transport system permease protein [Paramicrobacterium humi]|uniref:Putative ABC transport system permease protein n=1 Tax=Paramicrobacterium humi TaxID=640635 RepID=A0A1H4KPR8_9MICO|nr:ABC transporter permease [Microbacterium humi]SEB60524.1 putative ABC transport system permease protein [Microbacterium humi]
MDWPQLVVTTLVCVGILVALTTGVLWGFRIPHRWAPALAILRGTLQLAAISVILAGVISDPLWVSVALAVMFTVAASTATRRVGWSTAHALMMFSAMGIGIAVTLCVVFASGAIAFSPRYVLAIGGIVIGNAMSIATLAGRAFTSSVVDRWEEVEGWLALGATPRQSTLQLVRRSVAEALIPSTDQTKTTGLVTLPGAFVGAIFGGVSPLEAGQFQIVVLASIMAAGSITAVVVTKWLAPVTQKPRVLA